jgi:HD-GYP domain-containing protein (c-di-GMP phosphodiesterase class II)
MLSQKLRQEKQTEGIPLMFIVEMGELPDRIIGHQTYAHDYIQKPISIPEFKSRIDALLHYVAGPASPPNPPVDADEGSTSGERPRARENVIPKLSNSESLVQRYLSCKTGDLGLNPPKILVTMKGLVGDLEDCLARLEVELYKKNVGPADQDPELPKQKISGKFDVVDSEKDLEDNTPELTGRKGEASNEEESKVLSPEACSMDSHATSQGTESVEDSVEERQKGLLERYRNEFKSQQPSQKKTDTPELREGAIDEIFEGFFKALGKKEIPRLERESNSAEDDQRPPDMETPDVRDSAEPVRVVAKDAPVEAEECEPERQEKMDAEEFREVLDRSVIVSKLEEGNDSETPAEVPETFCPSEAPGETETEVESDLGHADALYNRVKGFALRAIQGLGEGKDLELDLGLELVYDLVDTVDESSDLLLAATDRSQEFSVSGHSANVAILSIRLAQTLELGGSFQTKVGLAALLHEVGVTKLPEKLMFKDGELKSFELEELRKRPLYSQHLLEGFEAGIEDLPKIVGQLFERENGAGFPKGLRGDQVLEEAKVLGLADVFEACIHLRPYRKALTGYQSLYELSTDPTGTFADGYIRALVKAMSLFPFNELIALSTGQFARVVGINSQDLSRPIIEMLYDAKGNPVSESEQIDLLNSPTTMITEVLSIDSLARRLSALADLK